jgi:hypothetical protein
MRRSALGALLPAIEHKTSISASLTGTCSGQSSVTVHSPWSTLGGRLVRRAGARA